MFQFYSVQLAPHSNLGASNSSAILEFCTSVACVGWWSFWQVVLLHFSLVCSASASLTDYIWLHVAEPHSMAQPNSILMFLPKHPGLGQQPVMLSCPSFLLCFCSAILITRLSSSWSQNSHSTPASGPHSKRQKEGKKRKDGGEGVALM